MRRSVLSCKSTIFCGTDKIFSYIFAKKDINFLLISLFLRLIC